MIFNRNLGFLAVVVVVENHRCFSALVQCTVVLLWPQLFLFNLPLTHCLWA